MPWLILLLALGASVHATPARAAGRLYLPIAYGPSPKPTPTRVPSPTWEWLTPTPAPTLAVRRTRDFTDPRIVKGVAADPKTGDVWAATYGGVVHWTADGARGEVFTTGDGLPENAVTAVTVSGDGRVVVGTENGAGAVRSMDGRWDAFDVAADAKVGPEYQHMGRIQTLAVDVAGTAWFGTFGGVAARHTNGSWEYPPWNNPLWVAVPSIGAHPDGSVWMGTMGSLDGRPTGTNAEQNEQVVVHRADGTWQAFDGASGLRGSYWADVVVGPNGSVWALAEDKFGDGRGNFMPWVERLMPGAARWAPPDLGNLGEVMENTTGRAHAMAMDPGGSPWFLTETGLLVPTDSEGRLWSNEPLQNGWGTNEDELTIGPDGTAWLGTSEHVVRRGADGAYRRLVAPGLPSGDVRTVLADAEGAWLGTAAGLVRARPDGTLDGAATRPGPVADADVRDLAIGSDGNLWVATAHGAARRSPDGQWSSYYLSPGMLVDALSALAVDRDGAVWCVGERAADHVQGVSVRDVGGQWQSWSAADGLPDLPPVALIARVDGSVWVSFEPPVHAPQLYDGDVLFRHDARGWTAVPVPEWLRIAGIQRMVEDLDGALWFSLGGNLARLDREGHWTTVAEEHMWGLLGNALAIDPTGQLWMGGYDGRLYIRRTDGQWRTLLLPGGDYTPGVRDMAFGPDGQVWLAQAGGARWLELGR